MKTAVYFLSFLCAFFFFGEKEALASSFHSEFSRQPSLAKQVNSFGQVTKTELKSSQSNQIATDLDSIVAIEEDDDEEQELVGKQAPVTKTCMVVEALCALPPPASITLKTRTLHNLSFSLCPCRYLVHRALLI